MTSQQYKYQVIEWPEVSLWRLPWELNRSPQELTIEYGWLWDPTRFNYAETLRNMSSIKEFYTLQEARHLLPIELVEKLLELEELP